MAIELQQVKQVGSVMNSHRVWKSRQTAISNALKRLRLFGWRLKYPYGFYQLVWQYYLKRYFFAVCLHYAVFLQQCVHFDRVVTIAKMEFICARKITEWLFREYIVLYIYIYIIQCSVNCDDYAF
jgi:hypothetical protein